jgi:hypothetical protein
MHEVSDLLRRHANDSTRHPRRPRHRGRWAYRDHEAELRARREELAEAAAAKVSEGTEGLENPEVLYGQSTAFVHDVRPAGEVVRTVKEEAERILRFRPSSVLA